MSWQKPAASFTNYHRSNTHVFHICEVCFPLLMETVLLTFTGINELCCCHCFYNSLLRVEIRLGLSAPFILSAPVTESSTAQLRDHTSFYLRRWHLKLTYTLTTNHSNLCYSRGAHTFLACELLTKWPSQNDIPTRKYQNVHLFITLLRILSMNRVLVDLA